MKKNRILFMPLVDAASLNAQSLNTREIVLRLDKNRFECTLFYTHEPDPRLLNLPHIKLLRLPSRLKTLSLLREMFSGCDIVAYVDYSPASYLYLHSPKFLRARTKAVMHVEGLSELGGLPPMLNFLYKGNSSKCDFYTGITECSAQNFNSVFRREVLCILPVGVNPSVFPSRPKSKNGDLSVLFVGTLSERKRPLLVLEAAARYRDTKFRLIGPDRHGYEQVVRQRMAKLNLDNVAIEGAKSQQAIALAMQESDVFLLPSRVEGLPKVTLEAAACGLPCIVFRAYETPSVVDHVTGFQVNTNDEMIEKLGVLLENAEMRECMGSAGRKLAEKFNWDNVVQLWQDAYLKIAAKG
ncbi:MAG TPA: glycosyltransferase family 4 protein [Terriglobales bacterium]|nr:glycosyltransferase family 4 protein [Terriglobales bacterium]